VPNTTDMIARITFTLKTHDQHAKSPNKRIRKWDGRTPYGVHPSWCALTLLCETNLPEDLRERGYYALLLHDILEDTNAQLPDDTPDAVRSLVAEMTFPGGSAQEMQEVWTKSTECKLLKLFDKVSNLLDATWMDAVKLAGYREYTLHLADEVEQHYPNLNITRMARAICAD